MSRFKIQPWQQGQYNNYLNGDADLPHEIISLKKLSEFNRKAQKSSKKNRSKKPSKSNIHRECSKSDEFYQQARTIHQEKKLSSKRIEVKKNITQLKFQIQQEQEEIFNQGLMKRPIKHRSSSAKNKSLEKSFFPFGTTFCRSDKNIISKSSYSSKNLLKNHNKTQNVSPAESRIVRQINKKSNLINTQLENTNYSFKNRSAQSTFYNHQLSIERKIFLMKSGEVEKFTKTKKIQLSKLSQNLEKKYRNEIQVANNFKNLIGKIYPQNESKEKNSKPDLPIDNFP